VAPSPLRASLAFYQYDEFERLCWPVASPGRTLQWDWVADAISLHLQALGDGRISRLLIQIPPRQGKSKRASVLFPAWHLLRRPSTQIIAVAADGQLAIRDATECRDVLYSHEYELARRAAERRGVCAWSVREDSEAKSNYLTSAGGCRRSQSTGQRITGSGGDLVIFDDPVDASHAYTGSVRMKYAVSWFRETLSSRENSERSLWLGIAQRQHADDLNGYILQAEPDLWTVLTIPAEYEGDDSPNALGWRDPRTTIGELVPRITRDQAAVLKRRLGWRWEAQYQQRPASSSGEVFKREWLRFWHADELPVFDAVCISIDTALRTTRHSDCTAIQAWGFAGPSAYLLAEERGRLSLVEIIDRATSMHALLGRVDAVLVEHTANGGQVIGALRDRVAGVVGVEQFGDRSSKLARAYSVSPRWQAGQVYLPTPEEHSPWTGRPQDWVADCIEEHLVFPGGDHDDRVDASCQALQWRTQGDGDFWVATG